MNCKDMRARTQDGKRKIFCVNKSCPYAVGTRYQVGEHMIYPACILRNKKEIVDWFLKLRGR